MATSEKKGHAMTERDMFWIGSKRFTPAVVASVNGTI